MKKKEKVAQSCLTLCDPTDYTVHGILQARILEWVAFPFSRGSSQLRDWTRVSCTAGRFFTSWGTMETQSPWGSSIIFKQKGPDTKNLESCCFQVITVLFFLFIKFMEFSALCALSSCWGSITLSWRWSTPFLGAVEYTAGLASLMGLQITWSSMAPDKHLPVTGHPVRSPLRHSSWTCRKESLPFIPLLAILC